MPIINMVYKKKKGWKPGANTIAYFPLIDDTLDKVGNYTITTGVATKKTIGYNFTGRAEIHNMSTSIIDRTLSMWIKINNFTTGIERYLDLAETKKYNIQYYYYHSGNLSQKYTVFTSSTYNSVTGSSSVSTGNWYHFCSVADTDNNKMYGYINGVKVVEYNGLGYDFGFTKIRLFAARNNTETVFYTTDSSDLSEVIVEDKARTADEISKYYNQTKGNYGL